jgi:hypothetical protein
MLHGSGSGRPEWRSRLQTAVTRRSALSSMLVAISAVAGLAQEPPLPDKATFTREVRARIRTDGQAQRGYSYVETRKDQKLDASGRMVEETVSVIESYPGLPGEERWQRVLIVDGKPVPASELAERDRERQREVEAYVRRNARQGRSDRERLAREREKERREREEAIEDAFRVFDFEMVRREKVNGHDTILVTMVPRPNVEARTTIGRMAQSFHGRVWISESDYEMVKLEVEALKDLSFGMGLLARIHKGTRMMFERRKVNNESWLPARMSYSASARVLLLRRMRIGRISEFANYKLFSVDTKTSYSVPSQR